MPEQYLTPPPPHELLATKSSFYARSGLFFLFFVALVFALTACNGGGGGSSSNNSNNGFSDDLNITFSSSDKSADTVIGMREFLLTVSLSNPDQTQDIVFIVEESATPPDWSEVENHPAKITRAFSSSLNKREIYFSATKAYVTNEGGVVDLSTDAETKFPGMMAPKSDYYVHAYTGGSHVKSSLKITTADYPASLPPAITNEVSAAGTTKADNFLRAMWGMEMWTRRADGTALNLDDERISDIGSVKVLNMRTIEVKTGEVMYFPFRFIPPYSATQSTCSLSGVKNILIRHYYIDGTDADFLTATYPSAGFATNNPSEDQSILFTKKYSSNYYDLMYKYGGHSRDAEIKVVAVISNCIPSSVVFYLLGFEIRQIAE